MAVQKWSALEKTSIQLRHTLKRLEVMEKYAKTNEEANLAKQIIEKVNEIRDLIPEDEQDVDLRKEIE